jgi:hypothetical protein
MRLCGRSAANFMISTTTDSQSTPHALISFVGSLHAAVSELADAASTPMM